MHSIVFFFLIGESELVVCSFNVEHLPSQNEAQLTAGIAHTIERYLSVDEALHVTCLIILFHERIADDAERWQTFPTRFHGT